MRAIERQQGFLPEGLDEKKAEEMRAAEAYFGLAPAQREQVEKVEFKAYKLASIKAELERMFQGKCAYCESLYSSTAPVDIEHYRPKGQVQEDPDHDGYWWLAAEWTNLLPSCIDCNRKRKQPTPRPSADLAEMLSAGRGTAVTTTGKKDSFPLADEAVRARRSTDDIEGEDPLLLNPCRDIPEHFIDFSYDSAVGAAIVFPRTAGGQRPLNPAGADVNAATVAAAAQAGAADLRGAVSIHVYGLNRLALVQARTRIVRRLEFMASLVVDLDQLAEDILSSNAHAAMRDRLAAKVASLQDRILQEMNAMADPSAEYSSTAIAWLKDFRDRTR